MKNVKKGEPGWLSWKKRMEVLKTSLFFGICAAVFLLGYLSTRTTSNLLTIVAVLGCLPSGKSAVAMIMSLRIKGCSPEDMNKIKAKGKGDSGFFNLYFTSYEKNYEIHHLAVKGHSVIAYTADSKTEAVSFEEHIKTILKQNGIGNYNVKLYSDLNKYLERIERLMLREEEKAENKEVVSLLFSISL